MTEPRGNFLLECSKCVKMHMWGFLNINGNIDFLLLKNFKITLFEIINHFYETFSC